ncbi:response regulator transcription factor [Parahaliea mediterranea]|uniref:Response regulator transcription factor n=1 Tax=Parahaliea mediterranea TaxID=651086 RepID=A0A939DHA9_9GAMM|nr:response regulator transcription factor [Parahaliea mediterranea]MBN7797846.1 response regulator transcription factor [Parahaliea mediterranea]
MRMLIVEDDHQLLGHLAEHFRGTGWSVDEAANGAEGRFLGLEYDYDAAIVDLGLPDIPGLELLRHWRRAGRALPVLILTARADWEDKVEGLESGADDYVTKPFHLAEVEARVRALQRRAAGRAAARADFGPLNIDFSAREVRLDGALLKLTSFEFNTLEYLANRPGEVVSKAELTEHLYDQDFDRDSNVIEVFIGRLRRKLDPTGSLRPIRTVRGAGYRFALESGRR